MFELLGHITGKIDVGVEIDTHVVYGIEKGMRYIHGTVLAIDMAT